MVIGWMCSGSMMFGCNNWRSGCNIGGGAGNLFSLITEFNSFEIGLVFWWKVVEIFYCLHSVKYW